MGHAFVEGHVLPMQLFYLAQPIDPRRFDRCAERRGFLLDFGSKRRINAKFSRGAAAPHPAVGHVQRFSLYQLFPVHILGARLPRHV